MIRLAIIVSHPIQYYVPLYRRLARRTDLEIRVFFTWHGGETAVFDHGFKKEIAWNIPLTEGYPYEVVPNVSNRPGTHHFWGLRNPSLVRRVLDWKAEAVHFTGYAYASHLAALRSFYARDIPTLIRGDSHLLDRRNVEAWSGKRALLRQVYRWITGCLYVGIHNKEYYRWLGVPEEKLFYCPHSIEVARFANPNSELESRAREWRRDLGISESSKVLLFAGKFEPKKRPVELMQCVKQIQHQKVILVLVGDGELGEDVRQLAQTAPDRFRIIPCQNQVLMPVVYRIGDLFVLPSAYNETWGLAINEALACGRQVLVSDKVGCAPELAVPGKTGNVFHADDWNDFIVKLNELLANLSGDWSPKLKQFSRHFDVCQTENYLLGALHGVLGRRNTSVG